METKTILSQIGVALVIIIAIATTVGLFEVGTRKISTHLNLSGQKAQVSSSLPDTVKRVQFKSYSAPADAQIY